MFFNTFIKRTIWCTVFFLGVWWPNGASAGFTTKIGPKPLWNATIADKLRKDLLYNYDKFSRPAQPFNKTTVRFQLHLRHVDVNEMKSLLTVHCYINLIWDDEKLQWNSSEYEGIKSVHLAEHEIWQPDISLFNSASVISINSYGTAHMIVYPEGVVLWVPPTQFSVLCDFDFTYWPFDTQKCFMKFGSWTHNGDEIDLIEKDKPDISKMAINSTEWVITEINQTRLEEIFSCCEESYPSITINLTLKRISPSYRAIIVTPAFVIMVLTLLSFWLPPQAGEKVILNASTGVIICLFLLYFTQKIPAMGNHTPLIVLFYTSCLYLVSFSMIGSIVVITLSRNRHSNCLPWVIRQPLTGKFGYFLGLSCYINQSTMSSSQRSTVEEMRDHQVTDFDDISHGDDHHIMRSGSISAKPSVQQDWILLAAAIDRILFIAYFLLFGILALVYGV